MLTFVCTILPLLCLKWVILWIATGHELRQQQAAEQARRHYEDVMSERSYARLNARIEARRWSREPLPLFPPASEP